MSTTLNGMSREDTEDSGDDCDANGADPRTKPRARARVMDLATPEKPLGQIAQTLARIEQVEDLLAAGNAPRRTAGIVARQWGINRRHAARYVDAVHQRWLAESHAEDRETKRARMRAMVMRTYQAAMDRERGIVVNVGDFRQEVEYVRDPDLRGAGNMLELLCRLDGLLEQPKAGDALGAFADAAMAMLQAHYFGGQPQEVQARVVEARPEALSDGEE